jgi:hypothetical protein
LYLYPKKACLFSLFRPVVVLFIFKLSKEKGGQGHQQHAGTKGTAIAQ